MDGGSGGFERSPAGIPASIHEATVATCFALRRRSWSRSGKPDAAIALHGGMLRDVTAARISFACARASSYDSSENGAGVPGR